MRLTTDTIRYVDEHGFEHVISRQPIQTNERMVEYSAYGDICPYCGKSLDGYKGLVICYCKYCGGKIRR